MVLDSGDSGANTFLTVFINHEDTKNTK
jgi:hypothetical protein